MVFCKECGSKVDDDAKFCHKCGKKHHEDNDKHIVKKEIHKHEKPKNNTLKVFGVIILLVLVFVPTNISYQVSEPTEVQYPISYKVKNAYQTESLSGLNWITEGFVEIENTDTMPGTFAVSCNFKTLKRTLTDSKKVYIVPGERKSVTCVADTGFGEDVEFTYTINPGKKTVTEVRTVTKQKTVQLYQKVFGLY